VWKAALVTGVAVAGGFAIAMTTLSAAETPEQVALTFLQAQYEEDWPAAWDLVCSATREEIDYDFFVRGLATVNEIEVAPSHVDLESGDVHVGRGPEGSYFTVPFTATSDDPGREEWQSDGSLPIVQEGGDLRVCFHGPVPQP
jgi:hypothetical protein